jgi:Protein of unknown function (DUF2794)
LPNGPKSNAWPRGGWGAVNPNRRAGPDPSGNAANIAGLLGLSAARVRPALGASKELFCSIRRLDGHPGGQEALEIVLTWRNHTPIADDREVPLSSTDPIVFRSRTSLSGGPARPGSNSSSHGGPESRSQTAFNRTELSAIMAVYGRKVAAGEWRDYAFDFTPDKAIFSIFRRASECPLFRVEKCPGLARRQGAYSVVALSGLILKRGPELDRVLAVLE